MKMQESIRRALENKGTRFCGGFPCPGDNCGYAQVHAVMPSWPIGEVRKIDGGLVLNPERGVSVLPVEFWNHELLEVDESDMESVVSFVGMWGIPYHPARELRAYASALDEKAIEETDRNRKAYLQLPRPDQIDSNGVIHVFAGSPTLCFVSDEEVRRSILWLKLAVLNIVYGVGAADHKATEIINRAAAPSNLLRTDEYAQFLIMDSGGSGLASCGLLTSAICSQIIDSFADDAEWRMCACEGCGRIFKRKRPDGKAVRPHNDSKYCCTPCKDRQTKRNQRTAARNRIKH